MRFFIILFALLIGLNTGAFAQNDKRRTNDKGQVIPSGNKRPDSNTKKTAPTRSKAPTAPKAPRTQSTDREATKKQTNKRNNRQGNLNFIVNTDIATLTGKYRYVNQNRNYVDGWRIQIIQSTDKAQVMNEKAAFSDQFPELPVYYEYNQPYFKLRVGNYATRYDAYRQFKVIREDFDRAFLVRDKLQLSDL